MSRQESETEVPVPARPGRDGGAAVPNLTGRQVEVLKKIANGRSYGQAATAMNISLHTVKTHARELLSRLGATDRGHAVALAFARGILTSADIQGPDS
jgi:DNA-binding NarL/FixJ family response regulator